MGYLKDRLRSWLEVDTRALPPGSDKILSSSFGGDQERFSPSEYGDYTAISNDFYTVAMIKARALAKTPMVLFDTSGETVETGPMVETLERPNPFWSGTLLKAATSLSLSSFGEAYVAIEREGPRIELWWVKPSDMSPVVHETDYISRFVHTDSDGRHTFFDTSEIMWIRMPNVIDEFEPLAPLAAARGAADYARSASKANQGLFDRGMISGGRVSPDDPNDVWSEEQAKSVERDLDRRFRGADKAHRFAVFRKAIRFEEMGHSPRDMDFVEGQNLAFRQVARAVGVPAPLGGDGEFATLANLQVYERMLWEHTLEFETRLIGEEFTAKLLGARAGTIAFDLSGVSALQEDETQRWERESGQLEMGAIYINEWRESQGLDPVPWGDAPWMPAMLVQPGDGPEAVGVEDRGFGNESHRRALRIRDSLDGVEEQIRGELAGLFARQTDDILRVLKQESRTAKEAARDPFDLKRWVQRFREALRPRVTSAIREALGLAASQVGHDPGSLAESFEIRRAIEQQVQTLAQRVNDTTWQRVQQQLSQGLGAGEDLDELAARVRHVMDVRTSDARRIAQTETTKAVTTGQRVAWSDAGVTHSEWVTSLDGNTRSTHVEAHGQIRALGEPFDVGGSTGPGPGQLGDPGEDINCRCTLRPVADPTGRGLREHMMRLNDLLESIA